MGMYHYVYSPKEKLCLYVEKTRWYGNLRAGGASS
jgi:hypothetical protein